jgi:DNA (cytosine-5)-methyltransferase 1
MPLTAHVARWPTPTTQDNAQVAGQYATNGTTLMGAIRMSLAHSADTRSITSLWDDTGARTAKAKDFPTPCATAHKGWLKNHNRAMTDDRLDYTIEREANESGSPGRLNPEFVEWLMGWPIGHTGLEPVAMDRYHEWLRQHSPICRRF